MRTATCRSVGILAGLALAAILLPHPSAQTPGLRETVVLKSIPAPEAFRGLTFGGGHLWSIDGKRKLLLQIDPASGLVVSTLPFGVKNAGALSWVAGLFWCIGGDGRTLNQVDVISGKTLKQFGSFPGSGFLGYGGSPSPDSGPNFRALAWDGKYLWAASEEGMVSRVARMDLSSGDSVGVLRAKGIPLGLASDGKWLWMATYGDSRGPAVLVRWKIPDTGDMDPMSYRVMRGSCTTVARLPGKEPAALAWDGEALWCADRKQKTIARLQPPTAP